MQETQLKDLSKTWLLCLILITTLLAAGPGIYQALNEDGLVFYLNGQDEGSYLQYDFAKTSLIATHRFVEFIVIELHEFGLSGGWINLVFDVFIPPAIILLIFYSFYSTKDLTPITSTIAFLGLTSIISATNPLVENYFIESVRSGSLYWVTMPATYLNPILRSPDPQWSYLLIAASSFFAIRTRSLVPLWIIAPFLYSFISIALIYILIGNFISRFLKTKVIYICFLAFSTISLFLLIYFKFFLTDLARLDLVNSRLPLISFTGIFSVAAYLLCKQRTLNLALAASLPWALANQQIISGWIVTPANFEQYIGVVSFAFCLSTAMRQRNILRIAAPLLFASFLLSLLPAFQQSISVIEMYTISPEVREILKNRSGDILTNSTLGAYALGLAYPRQEPTALSVSTTYLGKAKSQIERYRCLKKWIANNNLNGVFSEIITKLDHSYAHENKNYYLGTIFRRGDKSPHNDISPLECAYLGDLLVLVANP